MVKQAGCLEAGRTAKRMMPGGNLALSGILLVTD